MTIALATLAQAWITLRSEDPEAESARSVARRELEAGRALVSLRRWRLFEVAGSRLPADALAGRLHDSTRFYNPAKERCVVRASADEPVPLGPNERALLVVERGGARRPAAERAWRHATGERVVVGEATVWVLGFEPGADATTLARDLAVARDRRHGLFCNPHFQDWALADGPVPMPWIDAPHDAGTGPRGGRA